MRWNNCGKMLAITVFSAGLVAGCARVAPPSMVATTTPAQTLQQRIQALSAMRNWSLSGAISIRHGQSATIANYQWQQQGSSYSIHLAGALNAGSTTVTGRRGYVQVVRANGERWQGTDPNKLIAQRLGWRLPVDELFYWVRGLPAPGAKRGQKVDAKGHLIALTQQGWQIQWQRYRTVGGLDLPRWIVLRDGTWQVKILIRQWRL